MEGKVDRCMSLLNPQTGERDSHQYQQYKRDQPCTRLPREPAGRTEREANSHKTRGCVRIYQGRMDGSGTVDMTGHARSGFRRRTDARSGTVGRVMQRYGQGPLPSKHLSLKTFSGHHRSSVRTIRHGAHVRATIAALIPPHSGRSKDQATPHRTGCGKNSTCTRSPEVVASAPLIDSTPQQWPAESPLPTAVPRRENTSRRALPAITSGWPFRFPLRYNAPNMREADNSLAAAVGGHGFIDRFGMTINL